MPTTPPGRRFAARQWMLWLVVLAQLVTIIITWPVWNLRSSPVNLPLLPLPPASYGVLAVVSLLSALAWPRGGTLAHAIVVLVACLADQYRLQPQFLSLIVLMFACAFRQGVWFARWYLAAMWIWAGLHKLLSTQWMGYLPWLFLERWGLPADELYLVFAVAIALTELVLGVLAVVRPRLAAPLCVLVHTGIFLSLSPLGVDHNASVWPWNLATAVVGFWILRERAPAPRPMVRYATIAVLLASPVGFYFDMVNPHLAFILYSGNMPRALHVGQDSLKRLDAWGDLQVPFPDSASMFVRVFQKTAAPGDKLYVADPRRFVEDRYYLKARSGRVERISRDRYHHSGAPPGEVAGIEMIPPETVWRLSQSNLPIEPDKHDVVLAADLSGPGLDEETLLLLGQLLSLRELKLEQSQVSDRVIHALAPLRGLAKLEIIGGELSDRCLTSLAGLKGLRWLHLRAVNITGEGLTLPPGLLVLRLPETLVDDAGLSGIASLSELALLDLRATRITSAGLVHLSRLTNCQSLNLSQTDVDDRGLTQLAALAALQYLQLARTKISDEGIAHLVNLPNCEALNLEYTTVSDSGLEQLANMKQLKSLRVRGSRVTPGGVRQLQKALPQCQIDW